MPGVLGKWTTPLTTGAANSSSALRRGDRTAMFDLQKEFHEMLHGALGPLLAEGRMDGAYDKLLVRLGGLEEMPLRLLSPYQGFSEEQYQTCKRVMKDRFAEWLP